ncbi:MnmC family methyltransferase [Rubrimonas cliftonensis]|uniref:Spermidine synthase n=1 Tax=Rubrimonas cliftonensis TaxID=89524 RepID=A0A1H3WRC0_9RHOB|nr:MnmC family methyltransferase [Rubrimonas cliftonensis]SDZ88922.1 spermidine synthase [Rubrimonas cliftonensis]
MTAAAAPDPSPSGAETRAAGGSRLAMHGLLVLSGFAGLGYQVVWTRMLGVGLGHEALSTLAVVAAFFAGLALGALALDQPIARSRRPGLWYAGLEVAIGVWTLALIFLIPLANDLLLEAMGVAPSPLWRWTAAFGGPLLLLAPATVAMGATLPAAERAFARAARDGRGLGGLYAANAAGAMAGALLTAAWLAPALGYAATLCAFAAVNILCAGLMLAGPARGEAARPRLPACEAGGGWTTAGLAALFASGLLGIGFEIATIRALAQAMQNTVYSFAAAVAVYLAGAAIGAALWQRFCARRPGAIHSGALAAITAGACATGALAALAGPALRDALEAALPGAQSGGPLGEAALAILVFGPASAAMGALFSALAQAMRGPDGGLGAAFAANTFGAALAPVAVGLGLVPALGPVGALAALALGYLALAAALWPRGRIRAGAALAFGLPAALAGLTLLGPFDRRLVTIPPGGAVLAHLDGPSASASVTQDATGARYLLVDGAFVMGGTPSYRLDRVQGHLALMLHPEPRSALFLGVGTGATVAAAAAHPRLRVEAVDILPEALALVPYFEAVDREIAAAGDRIALSVADARRHVAATPKRYDVILADTFHPARDGAGMLYTVEHFEAIRARLAAGGVFTQWLPLHQLDLATFRLIARSFQTAFPDARLYMGNQNVITPLLALVGTEAGAPPEAAALMRRKIDDRLREALAATGLGDPFALFGGFIAGPEALAAFVGDGPLNTDDHPVAMYAAPRTVYAPLGPAADRLIALTEAMPRRAADAVALPPTAQAADFAARLEAYWRARDRFIALGASGATAVTGDPATDAARLAPDLLEVVRLSPDFAPAYNPVLLLAEALARRDPAAAASLLRALHRAAPSRREAAAALDRLAPR